MLPTAAAIELVHTYSLIHDDLPAMDDDDLRRGRPTCHIAHGENVAILAGDGLMAEAYRLILERQEGAAPRVLAALRAISDAIGVGGMVGGQYVDVAGEADLDADGLRHMHSLKTGRLIGASVAVAPLLLGSGEGARAALDRFAEELGLLFQIVDDILDVTGSETEMGKASGSDERLGKRTYVSVFGLDRARALAARSHERRADGARGGPRRARRRHLGPRADDRLHVRKELVVTPLLDGIDGPEDLKPLGEDELQQLAQEVRDYIIDTVGEIGGHFGANLGTCELAVALHSVLESPRDKVLWDVGHQAYPHKVLDRAPRRAADDPQVRRARTVLLPRRVAARHHGRGARVHRRELRRRDQGGDAQAARVRDHGGRG